MIAHCYNLIPIFPIYSSDYDHTCKFNLIIYMYIYILHFTTIVLIFKKIKENSEKRFSMKERERHQVSLIDDDVNVRIPSLYNECQIKGK